MEHVNILEEIAHWVVIELKYQDGINAGVGSVNPGHCFTIDLSADVKKITESHERKSERGWNDLCMITYARRITEKLVHEGLINSGLSDGYGVEELEMAKCRKSMAEGHIIVIQRLKYLRELESNSKTNFVEIPTH